MGIFDSLEAQNWLRQWKAVFITRNAILPAVKSEAKQLHIDIMKVATQTASICLQDHGNIFNTSIISCRFHEVFRDEIKRLHKQRPSWKNAPTGTWYNNEFTIAKLFMQPSRYEDKTSFEQIDFNGIAAFISNCRCFPVTVVTSSDQARVSINKIRHMPDMCPIALTDQATKDFIDNLTKLLNEPRFKGERDVQEALTQLGQLKTAFPKLLGDHWKYIIEDIATKCLQDIHELCKDKKEYLGKVADEKRSDFQIKADSILSELTSMGKTVCDDIKKLIEVSQEAIAESIKQGIKVIEEKRERGAQKLKEQTKIGEEKIEKKTEIGEEILETKTEEGEGKLKKKLR